MSLATLDDLVAAASAALRQRYGEPIEGRHRRVFIDAQAREVIKLPTRESGISANFEELDWQGPTYARTRLDALSEVYGIPVVRMELVVPVTSTEGLPGWVASIDCGQVGYTDDGRLVAYDWDRY